MCLLLTASTEHLMARDGGPQPPPSMPLVSHFITFSRTPLSAFANMSSHHLYFRVISIVSLFLPPPLPLSFFFFWFCFVSAVLFFLCLSKESSLFQLALFRLGEQGSALMPWRLLVFFFLQSASLCILYDVIYSLGEGTLGRNIPAPGCVLSVMRG